MYHPDLGGEADAENKILFFHPPTTPLAEQVPWPLQLAWQDLDAQSSPTHI